MNNSYLSPPPSPTSSGSPPQQKSRKPYTITKQRENWTEEEHQKFLEALTLYDRDWKKIESFVGSKTVIQIRSHAQKYFLKVQKNNTGERIPPPRPKRKAVQPYPQNPKNESISVPWITTHDSMAVNPFLNNPSAFAQWMANHGLVPGIHPATGATLSPNQASELHRQQQEQLQQAQHYLQQAMHSAQQSTRGSSQGPNFSKIYAFLGSLFDPSNSHYTEAVNDMNTIDRETVQLLMHNLTVNLNNQVFRDQHGALLDQYRSLLNKPSNPSTMSSSSSTPSSTPSSAIPSSDSSLIAGSNMAPSVSSGFIRPT
eukprot:Phypoly_transcript_10968.p1 GENE.Phypoly_transcript_10968~~Phypoly_transcript_10968.p1  ORF type:complete len:327 (+),score=63.88 Phypoly_transcript_10968:45-983(+)